MTAASTALGTAPETLRPHALLELVRLLARETAASDFATRCTVQPREASQ